MDNVYYIEDRIKDRKQLVRLRAQMEESLDIDYLFGEGWRMTGIRDGVWHGLWAKNGLVLPQDKALEHELKIHARRQKNKR